MDSKGGYPHFQAPPPAYGFDNQPTHAANIPPQTVVDQQQQVPFVMAPLVGPTPSHVTCPSCRAQVTTRMQFETSTKTHIIAGLLCMLGCWCCVCIPYNTDSCMNGNHYCPSCNSFIGVYAN